MGAFFNSLRNKIITVDKELLNLSGSKLRQYFCSYRSICENFSISIPQYMQIFGSNVKSYDVWDTEKQGYINPMEMFSGLIIFSKVAYEDKIKFLYELFDLNEQGFLQYDDLAFVFISVCEATCKIYQLSAELLNQQTIQNYLDQFFSDETQLKYEDFIRWSYKTEQIIQFFQIIDHPFEPQSNSHFIDQYDETNLQSKRFSYLSCFNMKKQSKLKIKIDERFLSILKNDHILLQEQGTQKTQDFNPVMKWIYGIRIDDIRHPLHYRKTQFYKAANEKFIYICGKNVIVLYPKLNLQRNYTNHNEPVSCVQIASNDRLVASGQMGLYPSIHIWDLQSTNCIQKFDKIHKHSIKHLKFTKGDELLISVGQKYPNPLVVINLKTRQKILSTYLQQTVLNIIQLTQNSKDRHQFFMVLPSFVVKCRQSQNNSYLINYHRVNQKTEEKDENIKVLMGAPVKVNEEHKIILVDANNKLAIFDVSSGKIQFVSNMEFKKKVNNQVSERKSVKIKDYDQEQEIVDIYPSENQKRIYFLYKKYFEVFQIDHNLCFQSIEKVDNIPRGLFNLQLVQLIEVNQNCVILVSLMGDVIKLTNFLTQVQQSKLQLKKCSTKLQDEKQQNIQDSEEDEDEEGQAMEQNNTQSQMQYHKYCQIFKIQKVTGICFLSKQAHQHNPQHFSDNPRLVIASNSLIYTVDQIEKQLLSLQCLEQNIIHIHSFGNTYAVATQLKYLMIIRDGVTLEKNKCYDSGNNSNSVINGFKITADNLIVAIDQEIQVYFKSGGNYLDKPPKKIRVDHGIPIHISMTSTPKVFLVITRQKAILKLNSQSKEKNSVVTAKELNCGFLQTLYPESSNVKAPILFSGTKRIFLLAQPNGDIYYWNSLNHMIKYQNSYSILSGHSSSINELVFTKNGFISSGGQDGQVIIWQSSQFLQEQQDDEQQQKQQNKNKMKVKFTDETGTQTNKFKQESLSKKSSLIYMDQILNADKFCCDKLPLKDSKIEVIVKDTEFYKDIIKNINNILVPSNLQLYQPLVSNKKTPIREHDRKNMKSLTKKISISSLNFKNSFIYGFNSQKSRQSLFYIHHYPENKQKSKSKKIEQEKNMSFKHKSKQIQYTKQVLFPLNQLHANCKRSFLYFSCKTAIIWSPILKSQFFYEFHVNRITCAAVHPQKIYVCTAQISNKNAIVHVWNADSLTLIHSFHTKHNKFVSRIQFSRDGDFIATLGGMPYQQSVEIYNWVREQIICFRFIEETCFFDLKFNPYNFNEIALCGTRSLWIMGVSNRTLIKKQEAQLKASSQITCMVYTSSVYGNSIQSDIITGNSNGDICLFICGKYVTCKKNAHGKSINCLKLCELFKYKTVIISAGEDNLIKIWNTKFEQITCINAKQIVNVPKNVVDSAKINISPQSLDVYHCFSQNQNNQGFKDEQENSQTISQTILLVGTRNGSIFQVKISNQFQGLKLYVAKNNGQSKNQDQDVKMKKKREMQAQSDEQRKKNEIEQKVQINYISHFNSLPSAFHQSTMFDINSNLMITYSKVSLYFVLWNIEKRQMIKVHKLDNYPYIIKFSKTNFIAVGYLDGIIDFLQVKSDFQFNLRKQKLFFDSQYQPIKVIFSQNDTKIAVIYSKQQQQQKRLSKNAVQEETTLDGEQVLRIYQKVFTANNSTPFVSNERNTHTIYNETKKFKKVFWCDFNFSANKLLICYTLNDYLRLNNRNRRRVMSSFQTNHYQPLYEYILYDIAKRTQKKLLNEQFNVLNFSPAIRAKYNYYNNCKLIEEDYNQKKNQEQEQVYEGQKNRLKNNSNEPKSNYTQFISINKNHSDVSRMEQKSTVPINSNINNQIQVIQQFVPICQMAQYDKFTLMGTIYGQVFAVKSEQFYSIGNEQPNQVQKKSVRVKYYAIFDSPITNMEVVGNKLFVSAKDCGNIVELHLDVSHEIGLYRQNNLMKGQKQGIQKQQNSLTPKYYQTFSQEKLQNWVKYVFPKRKKIYSCKINCSKQQYEQSQISMEPYHIIGRNAYYKRNNVLIDLKDNLITFSGCNLLIMAPNEQRPNEYKQQFLKLDNSVFTVYPQISTITLSKDKRRLYAGTTQEDCQLITWDISTRTQLQHLCFKDYLTVSLLKVSQQQKHAVALVINKQAQQVIFFICLKNFEILASYCISDEAQICDLEFLPSSQFKFLACGVNYMAEWSFKGGILSCEKYNIRNPKDFNEPNLQNSHKCPLIFYSMIILNDVTITGGSDGYLYMWNDRNLIKKQNANPRAAILSLYSSNNSRIFVSGADDGKAIIWQLGSSSIIQKYCQFPIYSGKQVVTPEKFQIQSVNIGKNQIFIGTRSGEIHRIQFNYNQDISGEEYYINNKHSHSVILSAFDNDQINSCSFNISSQKLYILTQSGNFNVFNLLTNQKIKQQKIRVDNQQIVKMLVCKLSSKIYIVLKKSIDVYTYIEEGKYSNKFSKSKECLKSTNSQIKTSILSLNQRYLALLMTPNHLENAKIEIYDMTQHDGKQFFTLYKVLENIPANIEIIDFSTDNGYLVYKNSDDDETIIDLTSKQVINTNLIEFELEWNEQAKRTSKFIKDICSTFSDENKLRTVLQIMNYSVLTTDQMGGVRLFRYEQNVEENSMEYYKIYFEHLNDVYLCIISSDCSILVTIGRYDRSIIIWKIKNFALLTKSSTKNESRTGFSSNKRNGKLQIENNNQN